MRGNRQTMTEFQEKQMEVLNSINENLEILIKKIDEAPVISSEAILSQAAEIQPQVPIIDPLAHLKALEELEGLHEEEDHDELMKHFNKHGIVLDVAEHPWCGAGCRYAIIEAGYDDPGIAYNKASKWSDYGEECDESEPGAIIVHHTHVGIRTEDGGELGANVSDKVRKGQSNWFGPIIAARKPISA